MAAAIALPGCTNYVKLDDYNAIEGFADPQGSTAMNRRLGMARAQPAAPAAMPQQPRTPDQSQPPPTDQPSSPPTGQS